MIRCISLIHKLAVFSDFSWDSSVLDGDNRPIYCKQLNIIYGRNYSGKTTLSRIVRSLETGHLSDRYRDPQFTVDFTNNTSATQSDMTSHNHLIRVFNEDYVRENLRVFQQDDDDIAAFAVLGEENAALVSSLAEKETALGAEDVPGTLVAIEKEKTTLRDRAARDLRDSRSTLDSRLRDEARKIRENRSYSNINYDIRNIRDDIRTISAESYAALSDHEISKYQQTLNETAREIVPTIPDNGLLLQTLAREAEGLLETAVRPSEPIQDLLNDALLQEWARQGRELHEDKRERCGFCGNALPSDIWSKLDSHFSKESEDLRSRLSNLIGTIDTESRRTDTLLEFQPMTFYATHDTEFGELQTERNRLLKEYRSSLNQIRDSLDNRLQDIFTATKLSNVVDPSDDLDQLRVRYESLREHTNALTTSLTEEQGKCRTSLRLHQVSSFLRTIDYDSLVASIRRYEEELAVAEQAVADAQTTAQSTRQEIAEIKSHMRDERNGAEKVNEYLRHHFGHPSLSLHAVATEQEDDESISYRFEIRRGDARAYHLSEGERGLLAFCYFMARLDDVETSGSKPIVWIDDPISSLDENHIFFVYSIISTQLVEPQACSQLFISTHSLSFLKYLKRVSGQVSMERSYFLIDCSDIGSKIIPMPKHLKEYATEFHYLFHRLYRCAHSEPGTNADDFYGFGNNARKFLEMYLYFRYPDASPTKDSFTRKLNKFLGMDAVAAAVSNRVANEYSHLAGLFERGMEPVDSNTIKPMAQLILDKIREHDEDQYIALIKSVGETPAA